MMCDTIKVSKKKGGDYFIEGYQMLSSCRPLSRFMELAVLLISRDSLTFLLVRCGSFLITCASSHRIWWSFSIDMLCDAVLDVSINNSTFVFL